MAEVTYKPQLTMLDRTTITNFGCKKKKKSGFSSNGGPLVMVNHMVSMEGVCDSEISSPFA